MNNFITKLQIIGVIFLYGTYSSASLMFLLAINRFVQICFAERIGDFFSRKKTQVHTDRNDLFSFLYVAICWLTSLVTPIISLTSIITYRYFPYWVGWGYETANNARRNLFVDIDAFVLLFKILFATILYLITVAYMIIQVCNNRLFSKLVSCEVRNHFVCYHFQRQTVSKTEVRLTIQTMVDTVFRSSYYIYWHFFPSSAETQIGAIVDYVLLLISNAMDAYIYLIFNGYAVNGKIFVRKVLQDYLRVGAVGERAF